MLSVRECCFATSGVKRTNGLMHSRGILLLGIWLIVVGLVPLLQISFAGRDVIIAILGGAAGVVLLWERGNVRLTVNVEILLLGVWLIAKAIFTLLSVSFNGSESLLAVLALIAGILLVWRRR